MNKKTGRTYPSRLSATVHSIVTFNIPRFLKKTTKQIIASGFKNVKRLFNYVLNSLLVLVPKVKWTRGIIVFIIVVL